MTQTKYYLKEKCTYCKIVAKQRYSKNATPIIECMQCNNKDFTRVADVTELMETIKSVVTKQIWILIIGITKNLIEVVEE